ncbi:macro domain-containing protein [Corallococcus sp. AS-1-12]|uniref:type II toxin-antitoxin system antitoxin DNA ADP-ribosyl glycohydrolase DarG n=1 Tax=Corallococcus sp. AS-1-12 TaxID=2874598 RepID=UPI001CBCAE7E|nr:macro domain-containing protein [Corallococcus sp. AS-1-12]MBZ4334351.1 macro domain-containing protein [Corallococcus sp. AS-1-12]
MIEAGTGDLLRAEVEALVNTVNTEGVMGKGIALQFKQAFPDNFKAYKKACDREEVRPGTMFVFDQGGLAGGPRYIINFPTKRHWRAKSRIEDIESGLRDLVRVIKERKIASIAVPPLGCGNGGLRWSEVEPLITNALGGLEGVRVQVFAPAGSPPAKSMRVSTERPKMTPGRAGLLGLMAKYGEPGTTFTRMEIQKLAYFLQVGGEPLRLEFVRHHYGPYAEQLNHVLERLEGHFIRGYGDRTGPSEIVPEPGGVEEAMNYLDALPETLARLERVARLFKGLESPYGAELLATVHWVCTHEPSVAGEVSKVIAAVHAWSDYKRARFQPRHVEVAWMRLRSEGWLPFPPSEPADVAPA